jgi:hypothetical protein
MTLGKTVFATAIGAGMLALSALNASAAVVCSGKVCWHAREAFEYPATAGVVVHPDDWRWGPRDRFVWREHEGRGYWHGNRWRSRSSGRLAVGRARTLRLARA